MLRNRVPSFGLLSSTALNNLRFGTATPIRYYFGSNQVQRIYLGTNLVYSL
jgi:hypothetical protein